MAPRRKKSKASYAEEEDEDDMVDVPPPAAEDEDEEEEAAEKPRGRASKKKKAAAPPAPADDDDDEFEAPAEDEDAGMDEDDDDEDDEEDDDAAEDRLVRRMRNDSDSSSSAGIIHEIYCEHFMCHKKLAIKPCRRINFINGANGSGKSAILAALQICLGASAKSTHRGNRMGDLVREGYEGQALVRVSLVNEGSDAAKPEVYGSMITIQRRFSRRGPASLQLLGADGACKSKDKKELRFILDTLKVSVDNPVCVLDQENSKNFIRGKGKEKYQFFLKATEIADVQNRISKVNLAANKCLNDAAHQRAKLEHFARLFTQAEAEYEEVKRLAKYDDEIRDLKVTLAWVSARASEKTLAAAEGHLAEAAAAREQYDAKVADCAKKLAELKGDEHGSHQQRLEDRLTRLKDVDLAACQESTSEVSAAIGSKNAEVKKAMQLEKKAAFTLKDSERDKQALQQKLGDARKRNAKEAAKFESNSAGAQIAKLEQAFKALEADEADLAGGGAGLEEAALAADDAAKAAATAERDALAKNRDAKAEADHLEGTVRHLEQAAASPLGAFGAYQAQLAKELARRSRDFDRPPVGPIGAHVKLASAAAKKWAGSIDDCCGRQLASWIVGSKKDQKVFYDVARKLNCAEAVKLIIQVPRPRHKIRDLVQEHGLTTVASLLKVDDDACFNALVDLSDVDSTCLFDDKADAETRGMVQRGGAWDQLPGVRHLLVHGGARTGAKKGTLFFRNGSSRRQALIGVDASADLPGARRDAADARHRADALVAEARDASKAAKGAAAAATRAKAGRDKAARDLQLVRRKLRDARTARDDAVAKTNEELVVEPTDGLESDIADCDADIVANKRALADAKSRVADARAELKPLEATKAQHRERNEAIIAEMEGIHDQMAQSVQIEQQAKRVLEKSEKKRDEAKRTEAKHAEAVEEEQKRHGDVVDKATRYTRQLWGETWDGVARPDDVKKYKSQEAVKARIEHTEQIKAKALKRRGVTEVDPEVAKEKMDRARHAYFEKESGCKQIEREGDQLKQDAQERWNRLKRIRQYICRRSNNEFDNILQAKGSAGKLDFEHKEKTLGLTYQKDNADDANIINNITSLSGGERSFSTLAMLISLGATIECPFRVMDEFDVFMDQVSRKVAMRELVDMAKRMESRQFIFITPQDLSSLPQSDILKIFKMNPPIRGQRTLEEAFATQG